MNSSSDQIFTQSETGKQDDRITGTKVDGKITDAAEVVKRTGRENE